MRIQLTPMIGRCDRAIRFGAGFFETHAPQSMVRAVALLFGAAAAICALAAYDLAHRPHLVAEHIQAIDALSRMAGVLGISGSVALLTRTRSTSGGAP
jgi:hypothetical protein